METVMRYAERQKPKIKEDDTSNRTLLWKKEYLFCDACKCKTSNVWFYCEQDNCLYCFGCTNYNNRRNCYGNLEHEDICIHKVIGE